MWDWIPVGCSDVVQCPVVTAWTPITWDLLGHHMEGGRPAARGGSNDPSSNMWSNSRRAISSPGDRRRALPETGGPVRDAVFDDSRGDARLGNRWKFRDDCRKGVAVARGSSDGLGDVPAEMMPGTCRLVTASTRRR